VLVGLLPEGPVVPAEEDVVGAVEVGGVVVFGSGVSLGLVAGVGSGGDVARGQIGSRELAASFFSCASASSRVPDGSPA